MTGSKANVAIRKVTAEDGAPEARTARRPRYEQVKHGVEEYIRENRLQPGDRLPTEAELQSRFGWSRITISRALGELVWEGRLRRVQGSGTFVAEPRPESPTAPRSTLRIVVSSRTSSRQADYENLLFAGVREEAADRRIDIVFYTASPVPTPEDVRRLDADGVLALSWQTDAIVPVQALRTAGVPVVGLALRSRGLALPLVCTDNYGGMVRAVEHLHDAGHTRVALVTQSLQSSDILERINGFHYAHAQAGSPVDPAYLLAAVHDVAPLFEPWWRSFATPPTALLLDGTMAPLALSVLQRNGVRVPEDVSIIVIDDTTMCRYFTPPLTAISQPTYDLGRRGLAKLIAMIVGEDDGAPEVLPTELIVRGSVAAPRAAAISKGMPDR